MVNKYSLPSMT